MYSNSLNCHILHLDKFIPGFLDFVADNIGHENNSYYAFGAERYPWGLRPEHPVKWVKDKESLRALVNDLHRAERIFLHGLFEDVLVNLLYENLDLLGRCYWLAWGGDLYRYRDELKSPRARVIESKRRVIIASMGYFVTDATGDYEICCKIYKTTAVHIKSQAYPSNFGHGVFRPQGQQDHGRYRVLIGNSATPENQHLEAFDFLGPFSKELQVICPLTYGSEEYRRQVISAGTKIFPGAFEPIIYHQPIEKYRDLLLSVHIGYFNHNRQQAMGTITHLLGMGKTVYVSHSLSHARFFLDLGVKIFEPCLFSKLLLSDLDARKNHEIMNETFSYDSLKRQLLFLFSY